jgi:hypothetical protein
VPLWADKATHNAWCNLIIRLTRCPQFSCTVERQFSGCGNGRLVPAYSIHIPFCGYCTFYLQVLWWGLKGSLKG